MHIINIPYSHGYQTLHIEKSRLAAVLQPNSVQKASESEEEIVKKALENPIASNRLCEMTEGKRRVLVITSDHTRPVPSKVTMPLLLNEIRANNPNIEITILIATGMHRPTTEKELRIKLGDFIVEHEKIVVHKAESDEMAFFGFLPSGGELWLNKLVKETNLVVAEGFIEPHFFAGFSGGRKSILPGVAAAKTVLYNHNARFLKSPYARQGSLEQNPIHADMLYAAEQAKLAFILNVLIDEKKKVISAVAGHYERAHRKGCDLCEQLSCQTVVKGSVFSVSPLHELCFLNSIDNIAFWSRTFWTLML